MKILKVVFNECSMFKDKITLDFYATQRVYQDELDGVYHNFKSIYTNNNIAIVGKNASGKTTLLKLVSSVFSILNGGSLREIEKKYSVLSYVPDLNIEVLFCANNNIYKLESKIKKENEDELGIEKYIFSEERIYLKKQSRVKNKNDLFIFDLKKDLYIERGNNKNDIYLQDDISIISAITKTDANKITVANYLNFTNYNLLTLPKSPVPVEFIQFLDASIEFIKYDESKEEFILKFYDKDEIIAINQMGLLKYLSSGTVKALNLFFGLYLSLKRGGYLIIDELENHFHREIVATFIRFFNSSKINKNGATLIFSTHYFELLDEFERCDNIYVSTNRDGIQVNKVSGTLSRNDIKKSEKFKSGMLMDTAVDYEKYIKLKRYLGEKI